MGNWPRIRVGTMAKVEPQPVWRAEQGGLRFNGNTQGHEAQQFPVNGTDAVHVYSDDTHIWVQLRRDVPTDLDIGRTSFKFAIGLQPGTAHKLGLKLINVADRNREQSKVKAKAVQK